jgi:hypothetical protein
MDSQRVVKALHDIDPGFVVLCKTLFGDAVHAEEVWDYLYTPDGVSKMSPGQSDVHVNHSSRGRLRPSDRNPQVPAVKIPKKINPKMKDGTIIDNTDAMSKSDGYTVTWAGEFAKTDEDKRQVFGWASVVELNGQPVVDRQGDWISPDEMEKAAYEYVLKSRKGGHQHKRDGENPFHASDMIESFVMTPEKISKMGLPDDTPVGWWVGYKVHDEDAWSKIKKGEVTGFSIHGRGKRREVDA